MSEWVGDWVGLVCVYVCMCAFVCVCKGVYMCVGMYVCATVRVWLCVVYIVSSYILPFYPHIYCAILRFSI